MPEVQKIIGQDAIAAAASANVCAPAAGKSHVVSTLVIHNPNVASATVDIFAREAGAAKGTGNQLVNDHPVAAGATETFRLGITLGGTAGDILTVDAATNGVTVTAFGAEITH